LGNPEDNSIDAIPNKKKVSFEQKAIPRQKYSKAADK